MGYTKDTIKGISWIGVLRFSTRGVSFFRTVVLARLLSPIQFGVFGIAILITALLEVLTETAVNVFLIQEKEDIEKYINSAWVISILRGILISILILLSSKFVSDFFHSPESLFLLQLISLVPLIRGFINPSVVKFQKHLEFHKEFWYKLVIFSFDASIAVLFAFITRNAISLVFGLIASALLEAFLSFYIVRPLPSIAFDRTYFSKIFHKGKWITLSGIFNYLYHNVDNIVVGRILGVGALGIYEVAYRISMLPITEISDVISKVTFPVYAKISDDIPRLKWAFLRTIVFVSILAIPFGIILIIFPSEIIRTVLGEKWLSMVPVLKILAIFGVIRAISGSTSALFLAIGKQQYVTVVTLASIIGLAIPIIPLTVKFGIIGAGVAVLIGSLVSLPFMIYYSIRTLILYEKSRS